MNRTKILIADDESNIRLMLRTALESDYQITEAGNGRDAMDAIRNAVAHAGVPDLVLLDLNMPVMDGMAVLEELTTLTASERPRVVVLTAYGSIQSAVKATRLGAADFLEKPVLPQALRDVVRDVLDEQQLPIAPRNTPAAGFEQVLDRVRQSLRSAHLEDAESLLARASSRREQQAADQFNLLGVLYESQSRWRLAKKFYGKAIAADGRCTAAQVNMQRIYELYTFGRSTRPILLGDEPPALASAMAEHA